MISEKFIKMIEDNAEEITGYWIADIRQNVTTPVFHQMTDEVCIPYGTALIRELGDWLDEGKKGQDVKDVYLALGKKRAKEGVALGDVVSAHLLLKRHIWLYVLSHGFLSTAFELYQVLELNNRVVHFFDNLVFWLVYGYGSETTAKIEGMDRPFTE
jgi:hypothetical protein